MSQLILDRLKPFVRMQADWTLTKTAEKRLVLGAPKLGKRATGQLKIYLRDEDPDQVVVRVSESFTNHIRASGIFCILRQDPDIALLEAEDGVYCLQKVAEE